MIRALFTGLFSFLAVATVVFADTSQFVFVTSTQSIVSNTLSGPITVQSQNELGGQESLTETFDFVLTSTSGTGQFLSSTGKSVSKTMAKGTANRTFYYYDSTLGTYTLTVTATGRTSKQKFETSQKISIVSVLPPKPVPIVKTPIKTTTSKSKVTKSSTTVAPVDVYSNDISMQPNVKDSSTTNLAVVYEGAKKTSVFDSLFDVPGRLWRWLISFL